MMTKYSAHIWKTFALCDFKHVPGRFYNRRIDVIDLGEISSTSCLLCCTTTRQMIWRMLLSC